MSFCTIGSFIACFRMYSRDARSSGLPGSGRAGGTRTLRTRVPKTAPIQRKTAAEIQGRRRRGGGEGAAGGGDGGGGDAK